MARKEFVKPEIKVVLIDAVDIITGSTGGEIEGGGGLEED